MVHLNIIPLKTSPKSFDHFDQTIDNTLYKHYSYTLDQFRR